LGQHHIGWCTLFSQSCSSGRAGVISSFSQHATNTKGEAQGTPGFLAIFGVLIADDRLFENRHLVARASNHLLLELAQSSTESADALCLQLDAVLFIIQLGLRRIRVLGERRGDNTVDHNVLVFRNSGKDPIFHCRGYLNQRLFSVNSEKAITHAEFSCCHLILIALWNEVV